MGCPLGSVSAVRVVGMTAVAVPPPFADASPAEVRAALLAEEQRAFDVEYRRALGVSEESLTLDELCATLACWRRVAWMTHRDPAGHRRMLRTAAERFSGEPIAADESLERTKAPRVLPCSAVCARSSLL